MRLETGITSAYRGLLHILMYHARNHNRCFATPGSSSKPVIKGSCVQIRCTYSEWESSPDSCITFRLTVLHLALSIILFGGPRFARTAPILASWTEIKLRMQAAVAARGASVGPPHVCTTEGASGS